MRRVGYEAQRFLDSEETCLKETWSHHAMLERAVKIEYVAEVDSQTSVEAGRRGSVQWNIPRLERLSREVLHGRCICGLTQRRIPVATNEITWGIIAKERGSWTVIDIQAG